MAESGISLRTVKEGKSMLSTPSVWRSKPVVLEELLPGGHDVFIDGLYLPGRAQHSI